MTLQNPPVYRLVKATIKSEEKKPGKKGLYMVYKADVPWSKFPANLASFDEGLWPIVKVGTEYGLILQRGNQASASTPRTSGDNWERDYYWNLVGLDPQYIPATYQAVKEQTLQAVAPQGASRGPDAASGGAGQRDTPSGGSQGRPRDPTRISIERQTALKAAADLTVAVLPSWSGEDHVRGDVIAGFVTSLAEQLYAFISDTGESE